MVIHVCWDLFGRFHGAVCWRVLAHVAVFRGYMGISQSRGSPKYTPQDSITLIT